MFNKDFESSIQHDKHVSEISFIETNGDSSMEIFPRDKKETALLKGRIFAARGLNDMDNPIKQNFNIVCDKIAGKVIITGNIYNAFNILKNYDLISLNFSNTILEDVDVKRFLDKTKDFILPENKIEDEATSSGVTDRALKQESYVQELLKLDSAEFESALADLSVSLTSKGRNVEIILQDSPKKVQSSH